MTLSGDGVEDASGDVVALVANEVYALDLLNLMVVNLAKFEFEVSPTCPLPARSRLLCRVFLYLIPFLTLRSS